MNSLFDPKKITEAMNYELDKELIKELFSIKEKPKLKYTVIEKKMIYDNPANPKTFKRSDDYFANYKFFRKYLMTGYNTEFATRELDKINALLTFSKALRKDTNANFKLDLFDESIEEVKEMTGIVDLVMNALLKLRKQPDRIDESDYNFSLFSEFVKASDQFSVPQSKNHIKVKYYNQNRCLANAYTIENNFVNCVRKFSIKELKDPQNPFFLQNSVTRINNTHIQSLFYGRDIDYFKSIDTFMSYYKEDFFLLKNREKDLFEGLYEILSHSNCLNFLSFLYTKSMLFKYIYDIFTRKKKNVFDKLNIPGIEGEKINEAFLNDSMRNYFGEKVIEPETPTKPVRNFLRTITLQNIKETTPLDSFSDLYGCLFFGNVMFVKEMVLYSDIDAMINKSQSNDISLRSDYDFIKGCLLINKNKEIKLFPYDISMINSPELHDHIDNVDFIKPDIKLLNEDLVSKVEDNETLYLIGNNSENEDKDKCYYAVKMTHEVNDKLIYLIDERYKHFNEEFDCPERFRKSDMDSDNLSKMNYSQNRSGY